MEIEAFFSLFNDEHEIGRQLTDKDFFTFFDNGMDVGALRQSRTDRADFAELLDSDAAALVRSWCQSRRETWAAADSAWNALRHRLDRHGEGNQR